MPVAWSAGSTLGPIIGGLLARPAERFPDLFGKNQFLIKHPYFLPCAIPATFSLFAWLITFSFLKETLPAPISIGRLLNITTESKQSTHQNSIGSSVVGQNGENDQNHDDDCPQAERPLPLRSLFIPEVLIAAGNYASLSLMDIAFRAIQPVFLSTPIDLGGRGLSLPTIGKLLSVQGILIGLFQVIFFARIHDRWGSKKTFVAGISSVIPAFVMFPVANAFARTQGHGIAVWTAIGIQTIAGTLLSLCWGAIFIFITAASPNRASLGATNGFCQLSVSIVRAIGPATVNSLFSLSIEKGYLGGDLVYYVLLVLGSAAIVLSLMLP
jgi:MFS family permease